MTKTIGQQIIEKFHNQFIHWHTNNDISFKETDFINLADMINEATKQEYRRGWEDCYDHYQWGINIPDPTT